MYAQSNIWSWRNEPRAKTSAITVGSDEMSRNSWFSSKWALPCCFSNGYQGAQNAHVCTQWEDWWRLCLQGQLVCQWPCCLCGSIVLCVYVGLESLLVAMGGIEGQDSGGTEGRAKRLDWYHQISLSLSFSLSHARTHALAVFTYLWCVSPTRSRQFFR